MVDKQQLAAMGEHMREMDGCKTEFKVPDGWKLVPVEPTNEMIDRAFMVQVSEFDTETSVMVKAYKSMLSAAPEYKS